MAKGKRQFGNVRKLPSGRFQARYTAPDGGYVTAPQTFAAKIHAETWLGDRLREIDAGAWIPQAVAERRRKRAAFKAYAEQWVKTRTVAGRPLKARTKALYEDILKVNCCPRSAPATLPRSRPMTCAAGTPRRWWTSRQRGRTPTHC